MQQAHQEQQQQQLYARLNPQLKPPPTPPSSSSSSSLAAQNIKHAQKMQQQQPESSSKLATSNTGGGGVIVEVQGGHIVRSLGRKDRHSKVCTAKGTRDRRVRLSAHTAIQFYDVQDRLGYDRPSKAVDWLIKNAKASIDELAELPAWNPTTRSISTNTLSASISSDQQEQQYAIQQHQEQQIESSQNNANNQSFLPPSSMDSDAIADTMKSFFPIGASAEASSTAMHFQNYSPDQDLRLSLQSLQDPMLIQSHNHHQAENHQGEEHGIFSGTNQLGFDSHSGDWPEHHQPAEIGRFQRMIAWNGGGDFQQQQQQPFLQQLGQSSQLFSQRGPLQSSNTSSIRAWIDSTLTHDHHQTASIIHSSTMSGIGGFATGDFSSFRIPARIQGEEERDNGISNRLASSASSDSRH